MILLIKAFYHFNNNLAYYKNNSMHYIGITSKAVLCILLILD